MALQRVRGQLPTGLLQFDQALREVPVVVPSRFRMTPAQVLAALAALTTTSHVLMVMTMVAVGVGMLVLALVLAVDDG